MLYNAKNYASIAILKMIELADSRVAENSIDVASAAFFMQTSENCRKSQKSLETSFPHG